MKLFIDMDGVLTDWTKAAHELNGLAYPGTDKWPYKRGPEGWHWGPQAGIDSYGWEYMGEDFWKRMEWMPDGREILAVLKAQFSIGSMCLFSAFYTRVAGAMKGRLNWIDHNTPEFSNRFLSGACKEMCAGPDAVLIDDYDENINKFVAAGGRGILVPRPWNTLHGWSNEVITVIKNSLQEV